jgi:hypothetical protein
MKKNKTVVKEETIITIDNDGVIIDQFKKITASEITQREPAFYKIYIEDVCRFKELSPSAGSILHFLVKYMSLSNIIVLNKLIKTLIMRELKIPSINTLNKAIDNLYKKSILIRLGQGTYMIDPSMFSKNDWESNKKLRICIEYSDEGRKIFKDDTARQLKLPLEEMKGLSKF